jgi:hypothetical protein
MANNDNSGIHGTNENKTGKHLNGTNISRGPTPKLNSDKPDGPGLDDIVQGVEVIAAYTALLIATSKEEKESTTKSKDESLSESEPQSEMDEVCGKHLKDKDPEYWNNELSEEQRTKYQENRNAQWKKSITKDET